MSKRKLSEMLDESVIVMSNKNVVSGEDLSRLLRVLNNLSVSLGCKDLNGLFEEFCGEGKKEDESYYEFESENEDIYEEKYNEYCSVFESGL